MSDKNVFLTYVVVGLHSSALSDVLQQISVVVVSNTANEVGLTLNRIHPLTHYNKFLSQTYRKTSDRVLCSTTSDVRHVGESPNLIVEGLVLLLG
jgi:hypothetical protein